MNLLQPFALWGLLALALPIALHLRRRRVGRTVQVGSVRHLEALPTAERRGLRLREPWLLLLRSLIFALIVLLLAQPLLDRPAGVGRAVALVDSAAAASVRDSLGRNATLLVERIDDPWRRVAQLDDSLTAGVPLIVAATSGSDHFAGPRPVVARPVTWIPIVVERPAVRSLVVAPEMPAAHHTPTEARALAAVVASVAEEFGPLKDTAGWEGRLPAWWRDSLTSAAFPVAAARVLAPDRAAPPGVLLASAQVLPRVGTGQHGRRGTTDPHWWIWTLAVVLFTVERLWAARRRGAV